MSDDMRHLAGRFIVIDGPDGSGKSTQLRLLAEAVERAGQPVTAVRDPGGTHIGDRIRQILLDKACSEMSVACELMLYMASRAQLVEQVVRPALAEGRCVLSDRYISSTVAYQGAGGADAEQIRTVGDVAVGGLWPDLTVVLDVDAETGLARAGRVGPADRMESKAVDFHRRVRELFLAQARQQPQRFAIIRTDDAIEKVAAQVLHLVGTWRFPQTGGQS